MFMGMITDFKTQEAIEYNKITAECSQGPFKSIHNWDDAGELHLTKLGEIFNSKQKYEGFFMNHYWRARKGYESRTTYITDKKGELKWVFGF